MDTNKYDYNYTNRIGNSLTEPFYQLYKANTKYLEASPRNTAEVIFNAVTMLLLNIVAIPLSLPLWFIGTAIVQYTSPKINYLPSSTSPLHATLIKINLLDIVKNYKERVIMEVLSHGYSTVGSKGTSALLYTSYEYRMKPNYGFETTPGLKNSNTTDSMPLLERQMILTKLKDTNRLIEVIQKSINSEMPDKEVTVPKSIDPNKLNICDYREYLAQLVSKNHKLPLKEASDFVATNFYSDNHITYQGANCLLQGIGVLS